MVERKVGAGVIRLVRGDVTETDADAFVFDITGDARLGSGYGGAIAARAGKVVQQELDAIGQCPSGEAVVTSAGALKARFIVHVNGPKFHEPGAEAILRRATRAALAKAAENGVARLAVPPIGTGLYQVPLELCARVLVEAISEHLAADSTPLKEVLLVAADSREYAPLAARLAQGA